MPNITERLVRSIRPRSKPYELRDDKLKGFLVRVQPSGLASYVAEVGRGRRVTLGRVGPTTPARARELALSALAGAREGKSTDEIRAQVRPRRGGAKTLRDYLDKEYRTWAEHHLKRGGAEVDRIESRFAEFLDCPLSEINAWRLSKWKLSRLKAGISRYTVARDLSALRAALGRCMHGHNAFEGFEPDRRLPSNQRTRYLTEAEEANLRDALDRREQKLRCARESANVWRRARGYREFSPITSTYADHLKPMVLLSLNTGLRQGELFSLTWGDIELARRMLYVHAAAAKGGKPRHIPLNDEARQVLESWKEQSEPGGLVFPSRGGQRFNNTKRAWTAVLREAGIKDFTWHDMRHTFASRLVQAGVDLNVVRELLGHADLKMTLRYSHLAPGNLMDAVTRIAPARPEQAQAADT